jgi:survival-of-motor-neuron-related-splicing factor 30
MKEVIIPKSLKILPTDSEEVRQQKRRKIRAIKSQFRKKKMEEDRNNQKNAWKEFKEKTSKKPKIGFLSSIHRESIFKSPDTVFGKVGVIGSGKEPTPTPSIAPFVMKSKRISIPKDFMK